MGLQSKYFNFIKNGTKRIELRLYDTKRAFIDLNDVIEFSNDKSGEKLKTRVIGLYRYRSFKELLKNYDISILADKSMTKENLTQELKKFYSRERQEQYGVIGIHLELID